MIVSTLALSAPIIAQASISSVNFAKSLSFNDSSHTVLNVNVPNMSDTGVYEIKYFQEGIGNGTGEEKITYISTDGRGQVTIPSDVDLSSNLTIEVKDLVPGEYSHNYVVKDILSNPALQIPIYHADTGYTPQYVQYATPDHTALSIDVSQFTNNSQFFIELLHYSNASATGPSTIYDAQPIKAQDGKMIVSIPAEVNTDPFVIRILDKTTDQYVLDGYVKAPILDLSEPPAWTIKIKSITYNAATKSYEFSLYPLDSSDNSFSPSDDFSHCVITQTYSNGLGHINKIPVTPVFTGSSNTFSVPANDYLLLGGNILALTNTLTCTQKNTYPWNPVFESPYTFSTANHYTFPKPGDQPIEPIISSNIHFLSPNKQHLIVSLDNYTGNDPIVIYFKNGYNSSISQKVQAHTGVISVNIPSQISLTEPLSLKAVDSQNGRVLLNQSFEDPTENIPVGIKNSNKLVGISLEAVQGTIPFYRNGAQQGMVKVTLDQSGISGPHTMPVQDAVSDMMSMVFYRSGYDNQTYRIHSNSCPYLNDPSPSSPLMCLSWSYNGFNTGVYSPNNQLVSENKVIKSFATSYQDYSYVYLTLSNNPDNANFKLGASLYIQGQNKPITAEENLADITSDNPIQYKSDMLSACIATDEVSEDGSDYQHLSWRVGTVGSLPKLYAITFAAPFWGPSVGSGGIADDMTKYYFNPSYGGYGANYALYTPEENKVSPNDYYTDVQRIKFLESAANPDRFDRYIWSYNKPFQDYNDGNTVPGNHFWGHEADFFKNLGHSYKSIAMLILNNEPILSDHAQLHLSYYHQDSKPLGFSFAGFDSYGNYISDGDDMFLEKATQKCGYPPTPPHATK